MNAWLISAAALTLALVPCAIVCLHGDAVMRLVGLELAGAVVSMVLVLMAEGLHQTSFHDLALTLALLVFGGGLVFARSLEKWL